MVLPKSWKWWTTLNCGMSSFPDTLRVLPAGFASDGLKHCLGIHVFRPTWLCLIVEVLATWEKFLKPLSYCTVINCNFTFNQHNFFIASVVSWYSLNCLNISFWIRIRCVFFVRLSNHTINEAEHSVSAHQLPQYYPSLKRTNNDLNIKHKMFEYTHLFSFIYILNIYLWIYIYEYIFMYMRVCARARLNI